MKVRDFLNIQDKEEIQKVKLLLKVITPKNSIKDLESISLLKMPYGLVNDIKQNYVDQKLIESVCLCLSCNTKWLLKQDYKEFLYFIKWLDNQLLEIASLESQLVKVDPSDEDTIKRDMRLEQCGIERLNVFEQINVIDSLAGGDILKWELIEKLPFEVVYTKLLRNKISDSIESRYNNILQSETNLNAS